MNSPDTCPHCGAEVPARARACPECGSCPDTGWSDRAHTDRLGLPEDEFDYDDFVEREFGSRRPVRRGWPRFWWAVACLVLLAFLAMVLR